MKHLISKKSVLFSLSLFFLSFLSSCHGVIFDEIRNEVKLADAKASGHIQNIIRYTMKTEASDGNSVDLEYVFVAPGKIYYRCIDTTHDSEGTEVTDDTDETGAVTQKAFYKSIASSKVSFGTFTKPTGRVYSIGADSQYLYAISSIIEDDDDGDNVPTNRVLWCYNTTSKEWESIWSGEYSSSAVKILSTNTPKNANRKAYFKLGSKLYELNGTTKVLDADENDNLSGGYVYKTDSSYAVGTTLTSLDENNSSNLISANSCAYFNGSVYFSSAYAMTTNETLTDEATYLYYCTSDNVHYSTDASTWNVVDLSCDTIYSLAVTSDYLLAGTDSGIVHTPWENSGSGVPTARTADFATNAASTLSSYYEVRAVLTVDPSLEEYLGTIFASSITSSSSASLGNVGLWSYFPASSTKQGEWNRE
ncbi:MAG: hypothetical protein IJ158_01590 [Treponema sp.]|nr:hypothetical protein [Treponema sp.]